MPGRQRLGSGKLAVRAWRSILIPHAEENFCRQNLKVKDLNIKNHSSKLKTLLADSKFPTPRGRFVLKTAPSGTFLKNRHCHNFCENFSKLIGNTILLYEVWFGNIHKTLVCLGGCIREAMSRFAVSTARECTFVHDRRGAAARREIDLGAPQPVRFFHNI